MSVKYTYSILNDFDNGVSTDRLINDIRQSDIVIAVDYIETIGDVCDIYFKSTLSPTDEAILDTTVSGHSGLPLADSTNVSVLGVSGNVLDVTADNRLKVDIVYSPHEMYSSAHIGILDDSQIPDTITRDIELTTLSGLLVQEINDKSNVGHTHTEIDITDLDKYTQDEVNSLINSASGTLQSEINTKSDVEHNHDLSYDVLGAASSTVSGHELAWDHASFATHAEVATASGVLQIQLDNLDLDYATDAELITISGILQAEVNQLATDLTTTSGMLQDQIDSLNDAYATDAELASVSGSLHTQITNNYNTLDDKTDTLSGTLQTQLDNLDLNYATDSELSTVSGILKSNIDGKADTEHSHVESDITDLDKYSRSEVDNIINSLSGTLSVAPAFIELSDTPPYYESGKFVRTTSSGLFYEDTRIENVIYLSPTSSGIYRDGSISFPFQNTYEAVLHLNANYTADDIVVFYALPGVYECPYKITITNAALRAVIGSDKNSVIIKPTEVSLADNFIEIGHPISAQNLTIDATSLPAFVTTSGTVGIKLNLGPYEEAYFEGVAIRGFYKDCLADSGLVLVLKDAQFNYCAVGLEANNGIIVKGVDVIVEGCYDKHVHALGGAEVYLSDSSISSTYYPSTAGSGTAIYAEEENTVVEIMAGCRVKDCYRNIVATNNAHVGVVNSWLEPAGDRPNIIQSNGGKIAILNSIAHLEEDDLSIEEANSCYFNTLDSSSNSTVIGTGSQHDQTLFQFLTGDIDRPSFDYISNHNDGYRALSFGTTKEGENAELFVRSNNGDVSLGIHPSGDNANTNTARLGLISVQDGVRSGWVISKEAGAQPQLKIYNRETLQDVFIANYDNSITLNSGVGVDKILDEDDFTSNDVKALATQQSTKAYVDNTTYSRTSLDSGQLDNRYYTESEIDTISGSIDNKVLYKDGSKELTADWNAGNFNISASGFKVGNTNLTGCIYDTHTGIISGGLLTINGSNDSYVDVASGTALYVNMNDPNSPIIEKISWPDLSYDTALSGVNSGWVGIYRSAPGVGSVAYATAFTQSEKRVIAVLGKVWSLGGVGIDGVGNYATTAYGHGKTLEDVISSLGPFNITGNTYSTAPAMKLNRLAGSSFRYAANYVGDPQSPNIHTSTSQNPINFYIYSWRYNQSSISYSIDPNYYDDNAVKTAVPSGKWTVNRIFYYPVTNYTHLILGQAYYDSKSLARDAISTENPYIDYTMLDGVILRGYLLIKQGATDLTDPNQCEVVTAYVEDGLVGGISNHSLLGGLENDDHPQYHNDIRGDARYYTQSQIDVWREEHPHTASGIEYVNSGWSVTNTKDALDLSLNYVEDIIGTGRTSPDVTMLQTGLSSIQVYAGNGYISYENFHKEVTWSGTTLDTSSKGTGNYYLYVDSNGIIQESASEPNREQYIYLGFYYTDNGLVGFVSKNDTKIDQAFSNIGLYMERLGLFIYDNGGTVGLLPGSSDRFVSTACKVQSAFRSYSLLEAGSNHAGTRFFPGFSTADVGSNADYASIIDRAGAIPTNFYNDVTASGAHPASAQCVFTNGSNTVTSTANLTSEIIPGDCIYASDDGIVYMSTVSGVFWTGSYTDITLYYNYRGTTITGTTLINKALPFMPADKYTPHFIARDLSNNIYMVYGTTLHDTIEDALSAAMIPVYQGIAPYGLNMATVVASTVSGSEGLSFYDLRPLTFRERSLSETTVGGGSSTSTISDHGALTGLEDDDHIQYILANGTRTFSGKVSYDLHPSFSSETEIVDKKYVDDTVANKTFDHGNLSGLSDDDHTQYSKADGTRNYTGIVSYNAAKTFTSDAQIVDKKYVDDTVDGAVITDHGGLSGLSDDDHSQYILVAGTRAFTGKVSYNTHPTFINNTELVDKKYVDDATSGLTADHGNLSGLGDDDHTQYLNTTRGDARYYTETEVDTLFSNHHASTSTDHDDRYYTESEINTMMSGIVYYNLPTCQVRRTTNLSLTGSWQSVTFDTTDIQNYSNILEHNTTNTERIDIKQTSLYLISFNAQVQTTTSTYYSYARIFINNTTQAVGSYKFVNTYPGEVQIINNKFFISLNSGDYITLQLYTGGTSTVVADIGLTVSLFKGIKGDAGADGAPGSGSTLTIKDEGTSVSGTPHSALNFVGSGVTVTNGGSGVATITINSPTSSITIQDEGTNVTGTPHSTLDFVGDLVNVTNAGGGKATVTIQPQVFGTWYAWGGDESSTNTTSTSAVQKATLSVSSIPAGYYRISWYYEWNRSTTTSDFIARVQIDNTTTIMEHNEELSDSTTWSSEQGFYIASLTAGNHYFDLDYWSESTGTTSYIRRARLEFWRVA